MSDYVTITDNSEKLVRLRFGPDMVIIHSLKKANQRGPRVTLTDDEFLDIAYRREKQRDASFCKQHWTQMKHHETKYKGPGAPTETEWYSHLFTCPITDLQFHCWGTHLIFVQIQENRPNFNLFKGSQLSFAQLHSTCLSYTKTGNLIIKFK